MAAPVVAKAAASSKIGRKLIGGALVGVIALILLPVMIAGGGMVVLLGGIRDHANDGCKPVPVATAGTAPTTWGYPNGLIPDSALKPIPWDPAQRMRPDAVDALTALNEKYKADHAGASIRIEDSYRSYAAQVATKASRGSLAAVPGTSVHGLALAVDLAGFGDVGQYDAPDYLWMKANAAPFGFVHPPWAEPGGSGPHEPWHWEYWGGTGTYAGLDQCAVKIETSTDSTTDQALTLLGLVIAVGNNGALDNGSVDTGWSPDAVQWVAGPFSHGTSTGWSTTTEWATVSTPLTSDSIIPVGAIVLWDDHAGIVVSRQTDGTAVAVIREGEGSYTFVPVTLPAAQPTPAPSASPTPAPTDTPTATPTQPVTVPVGEVPLAWTTYSTMR